MLDLNCNTGRLALCTIFGFAFIFGFSYIVHGDLLASLYEETPMLWRPQDAISDFFPYMLLSQFLLAAVTSYMFTQNYENDGIAEGMRFGLLLGVMLAVLWAMPFSYMPISATLAMAWAMEGILMGLGLGIIYALFYRDH